MNMPSSVTSSKASPLILRMAAKGQESEVAVNIRQEGPGPVFERESAPRPIWNKTLGPIAMKQSTIRKAKMSGIELM